MRIVRTVGDDRRGKVEIKVRLERWDIDNMYLNQLCFFLIIIIYNVIV